MRGYGKAAGWLLPGGLALVVGLVAAAAQTGPKALQAVTITYAPMSSGSGESAQLSGPQDQKGAFYTSRIHLRPGGQVAPHTHPDTRYTTVLSGTLSVCTSDRAAADAVRKFPAGSFFIMPAGVVHCSWALDGEVTYQESGIGPTAVIPVKK
jgi:quercetin dioxygenase-like cupin family protein